MNEVIGEERVHCEWDAFAPGDEDECPNKVGFVGYCEGEMIWMCGRHMVELDGMEKLDRAAVYHVSRIDLGGRGDD